MAKQTKTKKPLRALALDALRGLAILTMILSGQITFQSEFMFTDKTERVLENKSAPGAMISKLSVIKDSLYNSKYNYIGALKKTIGNENFEKYKFTILEYSPHNDVSLPGWMYHAQVPPPYNVFNPSNSGITWVDLVFPFFLFAMGTAFPFAISRRLAKGDSQFKLSMQILKRGILLAWFAIYIQHVKPWAINSSPDTLTWLLSLLGFALLFPMMLRLPSRVAPKIQKLVKIGGYAGAIALIVFISYFKGGVAEQIIFRIGDFVWKSSPPFDLYKSDIIILVLANVAFVGTLIWLFTRNNILLRLGIIGFLLAFRLSHDTNSDWTNWFWSATPFPWLYQFYYLQYLLIVIPGTIVGDLILKWMNEMKNKEMKVISTDKMIFSSILFLGIVVFNLYGLYARHLTINLFGNIILCIIGYWLLLSPKNATERLFKTLFKWAVYWLFLGLAFEAFEGGIKKDHATVSYYFVTTGLAIFTYISMSILIDYFQFGKQFSLLIDSGQNPMIAYLGASNIVIPIFSLVYIMPLLKKMETNPWLGFVKGLFITILVSVIAAFFSRKKIYWRT